MPSSSARRVLTVAAIVVGTLVLLSTAAIAGLRLVHRDLILPGVSVAGVDVGGLDREDARAALTPLADARGTDPATFSWRDREFVLSPADVGYGVNMDATLDAAFEARRDGNFLVTSWNHVESLWSEVEVPLADRIDNAALEAWVAEVAAQVDRDPSPGSVTADPDTLEVTSTPPSDGAVVRRDELRSEARDALETAGEETLELPVDEEAARIEAAEVEALVDQARRALQEPLTLSASGETVTLAPRDLAPMIALTEVNDGDDWTVELQAPVDVVESTFAEIAGRFEQEPEPARFEVPREPPVTLDDKDDVSWEPRPAEVGIVPSTNGKTFDPGLAAAQISEAFAEGYRQAELQLKDVDPEFSTADAEALNIDELLGTFTTYHACCQTRVQNIQRLADMVDGTVVKPGEQFSVNQISGERTCSKGFGEAGMILRGEIVAVCGGGVSQFGTTTVNAVFFSGLDPDTYKPHSFYISRYPMGREATLNYPSPDIDVRFTNDTGSGILVKTSYTGTSITVSIYGNNDVAKVTAIHGSPYNVRPYPTERRVNRALPPQTSRVVQSGRNGFSVNVSRVIVYEDGTERTDDWSNVYVPERQIVEYNPAPRPEPEPEPEPEPPPSDEGGGGNNDNGGDGNGADGGGNGGGNGSGGDGQ